MKKQLLSAILCASLLLLFTVGWAAAAQRKEAPDPADVSSGYCDPVLANWGLDQVVWTTMPSASPLSRAASGVIGHYVYHFGSEGSNLGQAFDLSTNTWVASTPCPAGYDNWCGTVANDALYVVGRYDGAYHNDFYKFTPTGGGPTGTWTAMAPFPQSATGICIEWDRGNYLYTGGGDAATGWAYKYDIAANTWTAIANMPGAQRYAGAAFCQGKFYVVGGTVGTGNVNYEYNPATNTWASRANVPVTPWFAQFQTTENDQYVILVGAGGGYGSWPALNSVQLYDPLTNTWTQETPLPSAVGNSSGNYLGAAYSGEALSAGSYTGTQTGVTYRGTGMPGGAPPGAPASPANFTVEDNGATLLASLSWTNPTTQVNGNPLTSIDSVVVLRNDVMVHFWTTATPGQAMSWDDNTITTAGLYAYTVYCVNSSGPGIPANGSAWIGPDVPNNVTNLVMTPGPSYQLLATLTWVNPTAGAHGGYYPGITGYTIFRESNEGHTATFNYPGEHTSYVDNTVPDPDYYWYTVTPNNASGGGPPTTSNTAWVGYPEIWIWEEITYVWNDISSVGTNAGLTSDDQNVGPFQLGFDFEFFNSQIFSQIRFCSNGFQSFTSTATTYGNVAIPTVAEPNNLIASFWEDLSFTSGGICYYYANAAAQTFTVQYTNVPYYSGGGTVTFQVILDNTDGTITVYYNTIGTNNGCTVGIENATGTEGVQVCYNGVGDFIPTSQTAIHFVPPGIPPSGILEGYVYEDQAPNDPIEGAMVVILADTGYTNAAGFYHIVDIYEGEHDATASAFGYNSSTESVTIIPDSTVTQNFYLPQPLISVDVTSIDVDIPANTPYDEEFNITNPGNGTLEFEIRITGTPTWVSVDPDEGTIESGESEMITVSFLMPDTAGVGDVYTADLIIDNNTVTPQVTIPITVTIVSAIPGSEDLIPTETALYQNYPNPFNPSTKISFDLHARSHVVLEIFNVLGQKVATVVDQTMDAGHYATEFNASRLASGIYIYRFSANNVTDLKKMILIR